MNFHVAFFHSFPRSSSTSIILLFSQLLIACATFILDCAVLSVYSSHAASHCFYHLLFPGSSTPATFFAFLQLLFYFYCFFSIFIPPPMLILTLLQFFDLKIVFYAALNMPFLILFYVVLIFASSALLLCSLVPQQIFFIGLCECSTQVLLSLPSFLPFSTNDPLDQMMI